jgi:hypothetical protein
MSAVTIRCARYTDRLSIARVMSQAFFDDNLFGDIVHPHRTKYPGDVNLYWIRRACLDLWKYRSTWLVAVVENAARGEDIVVGVAQWERLGHGGDKMECAFYDPSE